MAHVKQLTEAAKAWTTYWKTRPIPILEATRADLQQMLRRAERVKAADVAEVVHKDPLLTLQALRFVGSRPRSSLAAEVVSIESAVMLMGVTPFLERFCNLPTIESVLLPKYPADYQAVLGQVFLCRFASRLALLYANWRYEARPEEIIAAATLSRTQELLVLLGSRMDSRLPQAAGELSKFLEGMSLPAQVTMLETAEGDSPPRVVMQTAVMRLVEAVKMGWWEPAVQQESELIAGVLGMDSDEIWRALCRTMLSMAQTPDLVPMEAQPARWLPMLPGAWPAPESEPVSAKPSVAQTLDALSQRMQALHLAGQNGTAAKDIISLTIRALVEGVGMKRIVFSLLSADRQELRARYVLGFPKNHPLHELSLPLDRANLFARLLDKPQSLWFNPATASQFVSLLPNGLRSVYQTEHFCAMSIFLGEKPLGVILADCAEMPLTEYHYQHFKQICLLTSRALSQSAVR